ncbi:MAG: dTMP kinase [Burkholderiaceae bacterium]
MKSVKDGLFISFEGIDGAGKSTHIAALVAAFQAERGADRVVHTREPGGTPLAEKLRQLILNDAMDPLTESLLVFAARRDHLNLVIEPALARGDVVLSDRFTDATFAYQGGGRGFDLNTLLILEQWTQQISRLDADLTLKNEDEPIRQPDLTIWFDLPAEVAAQRLTGARVPDKFEAQPVEFFRQVAAGYQQRMDTHPARFAKINSNQNRDLVWRDVLAVVQAHGYLKAATA